MDVEDCLNEMKLNKLITYVPTISTSSVAHPKLIVMHDQQKDSKTETTKEEELRKLVLQVPSIPSIG